uniref:Tripartite motif containing 35 n=1 Tax=Latimeria chalumnae TaxID=7897 RepID=H3AEL8_LATCH
MASKATNDIPEEDLTCSICREIFTDPVTLQCGHYFCQKCVCEHWKQTDTQSCPVCRAFCSKTDLKINITLLKIVDALKKKPKAQPEGICSEHEEKLKLFCLEDQELICVVCQTSKKHQNHKCCPIKEAASEFSLKCLQESEKDVHFLYADQIIKINGLESTTGQHKSNLNQKKKIENSLHVFLCLSIQKDVKTSLTSLQDTEKKLIKVKEEYNKYLKHILVSLTFYNQKTFHQDQTEKTKKQIKNYSNLEYTKNPRDSWKERSSKKNRELTLDALNTFQLKHTVLYNFFPVEDCLLAQKQIKVNITVNPPSKNPSLMLQSLGVSWSDSQKNLPLNPERFSPAIAVLGYKGFTSGRHSRVVDVGNKTEWILGVTKELINRKGQIYLSPKYGCWTIVLRNGREYVAYTDRETQLKLEKKPKKVWISLDYEDGEVSFYNADDMKEIYTFKDHFTEKLYPLFSPSDNRDGKNSEPLRICPLYVAV